MTRSFTFYMPTQLQFDEGLFRRLGHFPLPGSRALIVTGGGAVRSLGLIHLVQSVLSEKNINSIVYDDIRSLASSSQIMAAAATGRAEGCTFVLGLGGGGCLNAARAIAAMCTNNGRVEQYAGGGTHRFTSRPLPIVCLPTLAEATSLLPCTFFRHENSLRMIRHPWLHASSCLIDPDINQTVPPHATGYHGLISLLFSLGVLLSPSPNPPAVALSLTAWGQLSSIIPACVRNGKDSQARSAAAAATLLAAMSAATCPFPPEIALALSICAATPDLPLGVVLSRLAPLWHDKAAARATHRYRRACRALGVPEGGVGRALKDFCRQCGLEDVQITDYGLNTESIQRCSRQAEEAMPTLFSEEKSPLNEGERQAILQEALT